MSEKELELVYVVMRSYGDDDHLVGVYRSQAAADRRAARDEEIGYTLRVLTTNLIEEEE